MKRARRKRKARAFTLIELLVTIAIMATLAGLLLPAFNQVRQASRRAIAASNLRQIGVGINLYSSEKGLLPGPLWPGQVPLLDPARAGRLVRELSGYLAIPLPAAPKIIDLFVPPAYPLAPGAPTLENARTFVMNMAVPVNGVIINPWGSLADPVPGNSLAPAAVPSSIWAMSDADRLNPRVAGASWQTSTPLGPIHSPRRLALYFDGRVDGISDEELAVPQL